MKNKVKYLRTVRNYEGGLGLGYLFKKKKNNNNLLVRFKKITSG